MKIEDLAQAGMSRTMNGIEPIFPKVPKPVESEKSGHPSFSDFMMEKFNSVNATGLDADRKLEQAMLGQEPFPHKTAIALQKADISFRLMMSMKQKIVQAYQQLIRTPL